MTTMLAASRLEGSVVNDADVEFRLVQFPWAKSVLPPFHRTSDGIVPNDALMLSLEQNGLYEEGTTVLCSVVSGNDNHVLGLLQHEVPFDFVLPDEPDIALEPGADILSYDLVCAIYRARLDTWMPFVLSLKKLGKRIIQLEMPPSIGDNARVSAQLDAFFRELPGNPEVAPKMLRYKLWRALSNILRAVCEEHGIEYIAVPENMIDNGFLAEAGIYSDATHGSPAFSEARLRQVRSLLTQTQEDPA